MQKTEKLHQGKFHHIYNHAVGGRDLFHDVPHYEHFLNLYDRYIEPVANTYAWALMPNHFHFLIKIKKDVVYKYSQNDNSLSKEQFNEPKWETCDLSAFVAPDSVKIPKPEKHISHLCDAYAKYINTRLQSKGTLFNRSFGRRHIDNTKYLKNAILYIHNNPVHHCFCEHPMEYPWTSYLTCISAKTTKLKRDEVLGWFSDKGEFETLHKEKFNWNEFEKWLEI